MTRRAAPWMVAAAAVTMLTACDGGQPLTSQAFSTRPTSGPDTGNLFLVGTVRQGGAPAEGVRVWLSLFPEDDDTAVGETVEMWESEPVLTDDDGRYSLSIDPDDMPSRYWPAGRDYLNFDLMVVTDEHLVTWASTLWLLDDPQVWRTEQSRPGDRVMDLSVDLQEETIEITDSRGDSETNELPVLPLPQPLDDD